MEVTQLVVMITLRSLAHSPQMNVSHYEEYK